MYSGRSAGQALESLRECLKQNAPPENTLGALREDLALTQATLASMSGVSQGYISEVESGKKRLSGKAAGRLAPVLGVDAGPMLAGVRLGALKGLIEDGRGPLAGEIIEVLALVETNLPNGSLKNLLMATLVDALKDAAERDKARLRELEGKDGAPAVATKSRKKRGGQTRDVWGRKIKDERLVALESKEKTERPERDRYGRRLNKPNAPAGPSAPEPRKDATGRILRDSRGRVLDKPNDPSRTGRS